MHVTPIQYTTAHIISSASGLSYTIYVCRRGNSQTTRRCQGHRRSSDEVSKSTTPPSFDRQTIGGIVHIETTVPVFDPQRVPEVLIMLTLYPLAKSLDHAGGTSLYHQ